MTYLDLIRDADRKLDKGHITLGRYEEMIEPLNREIQPTVQPERKRGEWINEGRIIRCNKCKIGYAVVKGMKSAITYNFCPSCGADMRGEE